MVVEICVLVRDRSFVFNIKPRIKKVGLLATEATMRMGTLHKAFISKKFEIVHQKNHSDLLKQLQKDEIKCLRINGKFIDIKGKKFPTLVKTEQHTIEQLIDEFEILNRSDKSNSELQKKIQSSVELGLDIGKGTIQIIMESGEEFLLTKHEACPYCNRLFFKMSPSLFSFNIPDGMCSECNGLGVKLSIDPKLVISKPQLSLLDGASTWFGILRKVKPSGNWMRSELFALADHMKVDLETPWNKLPKKFQEAVLARHYEIDFKPLLVTKMVEFLSLARIELRLNDFGADQPFEQRAQKRGTF